MSIEAINWALNVVTNITSTQKAVLISLADRADQRGICYPSYDDICRRSCATRNAVTSALIYFEKNGIIERHKRFNKSTIYRLIISSTEIRTGKLKSSSTELHTGTSTELHTASSMDIRTLTTIEPSINHHGLFDEFWESYPKKVAKPKAKSAFDRLTKKDKAALMASLATYQFSDDKTYIPMPSTFINQRRWEDEQESNSAGGLEI